MNQEKIGKFIAENRKKQNLTQAELAEKLGLTDRAISKWENGKSLPDVSIMNDLCNILDITLNELFSGEKLTKTKYQEKADENIANAINYTTVESNKKINKVKLLSLVSTITIILIGILIFIDFKRMSQNKPVIFSTWGLKYYPAINLNEEKIEIAIKEYLVEKSDKQTKHHENQKTFVSIRTYLIDASQPQVNVYAWVLEESHYLENNQTIIDSASSIPHKFILEKIDNNYVVIDSRIPRDGSYYPDDMKNIFPSSVRKDMNSVHHDGTIERLELDIQEQVKLYFHK